MESIQGYYKMRWNMWKVQPEMETQSMTGQGQ